MSIESKGRLTKKGNIAIFEHCDLQGHSFSEIDKDGVLWLFGYNVRMGDSDIGVAKRFDLGLKEYEVLGNYYYAKGVVEGDFESIFDRASINRSNSLVMIKHGVEDNVW